MVKYNTNLNITKDRRRDSVNTVLLAKRPNEQQRCNSVNNTGLDKHGNHCGVQSTVCSLPYCISNVSDVSDESRCDHNREEDIERKEN